MMLTSPGFLGTTYTGGSKDSGVAFQLAPNGTETVLHSFGGTNDGDAPAGSLQQIGKQLYGATCFGGASFGIVFSVPK